MRRLGKQGSQAIEKAANTVSEIEAQPQYNLILQTDFPSALYWTLRITRLDRSETSIHIVVGAARRLIEFGVQEESRS